jgi:hypothetical protein
MHGKTNIKLSKFVLSKNVIEASDKVAVTYVVVPKYSHNLVHFTVTVFHNSTFSTKNIRQSYAIIG